jgi:hypothetical protein
VGDVEVDARIRGQSRRGDVLFTERKRNPVRRKKLGMLGEFARGRVLFEVFRNPITPWEIETCVVKIVDDTASLMRAARRDKQPLSTVTHTSLCAITPSASANLKADAELTLLDLKRPGIYRMARLFQTVIVVVDELPKDASTLWLRLLGRGQVQAQAVEDLLQMSADEPLRDATFELVVKYHQSVPKSILAETDPEMTMNWDRAYERWVLRTKAEGRAEGKAEGKAEAVLTVLECRGLSVTESQRKQILGCTNIAQLDAWHRGAITTSDVNDLLAQRAKPKPRRQTARRTATP